MAIVNRKSIHLEVVRGMILMVREFRSKPQGYVLMSTAMLVGTEGVCSEAMDHVVHLGSVWLDRSPSSMLDKITQGDYQELWKLVNAYLFRAGYPPISPVDIAI